MIDIKNLLNIKYYNSSTYADYDLELGQSTQDSLTMTFDTDHYIYIGLYKTFKSIYIDLSTANTNSNSLAFEYYNGSDWTSLTVVDNTKGLTRSGYIQWDELTDHNSTEVDSKNKYWIRFAPSTIQTESITSFIGSILATDEDLKLEYANIVNEFFLQGESNFLKIHIACRDEIIQKLIRKGYIKLDSNGLYERIGPWDLLDRREFNQSAIYLAISKIYNNASDDLDDVWSTKSKMYITKFEKAMNINVASVDTDDDGKTDTVENKVKFKTLKMSY